MSLTSELRLHLKRVREAMAGRGVRALWVSEAPDLQYLSGRDAGRILVTGSSAVLWVKDVYSELYGSLYYSASYPLEVRVGGKPEMDRALRGVRSRSVAVSSPALLAPVRKASRKHVVVEEVVKAARSVKTRWEIGFIRRSCNVAKAGMRKAEDVVGLGVRELDAVAEIEGEIRRRGSVKGVFGDGMLLASGRRAADIHAKPSLKRIGRGLVVVDLGANVGGYFSDMTRTLGVGRLTPLEADLMSFVESLRDEAIGRIRPGMLASEVHGFVEGCIKEKGYGFYHLTGHGVGLEVHELPSFSPGSKMRLRAGMVFTVEPGIYIPGKFGVRFEDTVLLKNSGCVKLT